ncbi:hypothetical protein OAT16_05700 [Prolixibacteraceae bacterium]|nr:hypothetical protein [Prolixibacteraceae bacterium]
MVFLSIGFTLEGEEYYTRIEEMCVVFEENKCGGRQTEVLCSWMEGGFGRIWSVVGGGNERNAVRHRGHTAFFR